MPSLLSETYAFVYTLMNMLNKRATSSEHETIIISLLYMLGVLLQWVYSLQVNGVDLSKASHSKAVETIKTATEPIQIVILRRKLKKSIECHVSEVLSTRTQTDLSHDVDTDSGIHDRYSPRQDLQLDGSKFVDDGTSSSECSHRRIDFVRDRLLSLTSESLASSENMTSTETSETSVPRVTLVVKDVNYVNSDVRDENFNESLKGQPLVSAVSDEIYFDPELDYEYEVSD